jgi:hypothetical protein
LTSNDISLFSPSCVSFDRGAHRQQPPEPRRLLTDPYFLAAAIPAVIALGLAKGGFAGVGSIATPLVALILPPSPVVTRREQLVLVDRLQQLLVLILALLFRVGERRDVAKRAVQFQLRGALIREFDEFVGGRHGSILCRSGWSG